MLLLNKCLKFNTFAIYLSIGKIGEETKRCFISSITTTKKMHVSVMVPVHWKLSHTAKYNTGIAFVVDGLSRATNHYIYWTARLVYPGKITRCIGGVCWCTS